MYEFSVIGGKTARRIIEASRPQLVEVVRDTYLAHHAGQSVNPDSYFLRFPDQPADRIIALPAYLGGTADVSGIKWISSFPANIERGIPRASAALLLNDQRTGYPFACLEASQISAARTAASAALAARQLTGGRRAGKVAVIGAGIIARNIMEFLRAEGWQIDQVVVHDQAEHYAAALADHSARQLGYPSATAPSAAEAVGGADLVVLATTAAEPHITAADAFAPGQVVLNISLRDISPELIAAADNVLDDVEHCLKANTSPHLAEQTYGNRDFVTGTLAQVITGEAVLRGGRPVIFSPFGLGVLDLAVGLHIYRAAKDAHETVEIEDFFGETTRW